MISLFKLSGRADRRAYWQRARFRARAEARGEVDPPPRPGRIDAPFQALLLEALRGASPVVDDYGDQHYDDHTD